MNDKAKNLIFWVVFMTVACLICAVWFGRDEGQRLARATYSQFLEQVRDGKVASATIAPGNSGTSPVTYTMKDGVKARTVLPPDYRDALTAMQDKLVNVDIQDARWGGQWINAAPFLLLLGVWLVMLVRFPGKGLKLL